MAVEASVPPSARHERSSTLSNTYERTADIAMALVPKKHIPLSVIRYTAGLWKGDPLTTSTHRIAEALKRVKTSKTYVAEFRSPRQLHVTLHEEGCARATVESSAPEQARPRAHPVGSETHWTVSVQDRLRPSHAHRCWVMWRRRWASEDRHLVVAHSLWPRSRQRIASGADLVLPPHVKPAWPSPSSSRTPCPRRTCASCVPFSGRSSPGR
jgi:hypothetical protein